VIVQLTGGPLRSFTIGFLYVLLRLLRSVCFSYSTPATLPPALLPSGQPNIPVRTATRFPVCCPLPFRSSPVPLSHRHAHVVVVLLWSLPRARLVRNQQGLDWSLVSLYSPDVVPPHLISRRTASQPPNTTHGPHRGLALRYLCINRVRAADPF